MDKSKKPPTTGGAGATGGAAPGAGPGGKKGPGAAAGGVGKGPPKKPSDSDAPGAGAKAEGDPSGPGGATKDEPSAAANGDKKADKADTEQPSQPKPGSAGATVRDGAQKVLTLAMKSEWAPVEAVLKGLEKAIAAGGEDANATPLALVMDPVSGIGVVLTVSKAMGLKVNIPMFFLKTVIVLRF